MKCVNKLTILVVLQLLFGGPALAQQQPAAFGNQNFQQSASGGTFGGGHAGKNGNNLDPNSNMNMKFGNVKYSGAGGQPQFGNFGMGTPNSQREAAPGGRGVPVRGGFGGAPGGGNGGGRPGPVRGGNGMGNGRPMEQPQQQQQHATFIPPGPMATTISFGSPSSAAAAPPASPHFQQGKGSQEKQQQQHQQANGQANSNKFTTFPQSNSNGMSLHNSNLPSSVAKNTFGVPALNSWNSQPHLVGEQGNSNGNRFKVSSIHEQNFTPNEAFKFPMDDSPIQDNRFGPHNDGFGNTGSASTSISFGIGAAGLAAMKNKSKSPPKKGKFSWVSPEGQIYEVSYVADLKEPEAAPQSVQQSPAPVPARQDTTASEAGIYKTAFPYNSNQQYLEPPRNGLQELFGSGSQFLPAYSKGFMPMAPPPQRFGPPGRGF